MLKNKINFLSHDLMDGESNLKWYKKELLDQEWNVFSHAFAFCKKSGPPLFLYYNLSYKYLYRS